jgi:hypothetical protein
MGSLSGARVNAHQGQDADQAPSFTTARRAGPAGGRLRAIYGT